MSYSTFLNALTPRLLSHMGSKLLAPTRVVRWPGLRIVDLSHSMQAGQTYMHNKDKLARLNQFYIELACKHGASLIKDGYYMHGQLSLKFAD